jgi:hypothetical protein
VSIRIDSAVEGWEDPFVFGVPVPGVGPWFCVLWLVWVEGELAVAVGRTPAVDDVFCGDPVGCVG